MLSKSIEKYVNSLKQKKYRLEHHRFIAEGEKIISELLHASFFIESIYALPAWITSHESVLRGKEKIITEVSEPEMKKISALSTPSDVLCIVATPELTINNDEVHSNLSLVLDDIQDPGNMGTIIRIADWFGIPNIFCSENSVESYNPKVIQATMGSIAHVNIFELNLENLFEQFSDLKVYATDLHGENIFNTTLDNKGFILIGNEAKGISLSLEKFISQKITIPKYGKAESLNAAIAAGIVCAIFRQA